jgi:predicted transcriptional regulator
VIPAAVADSWLFWLAIIDGLAAVYILPTVIGIVRQVEGLGLVICLNAIPAGWPAALLLACLMPRKEISHAPHRPWPGRRLMSAKRRRKEMAAQCQGRAALPASVQPTSALACPCPMPCSDFKYPTIAICFSRPQLAMICCHSAIERPYFFSMDGKYDAGPCFGQGGACSVMLTYSSLGPAVTRRTGRPFLIAPDDRLMPQDTQRAHLVIPAISAAEQQIADRRTSHLPAPRKQHQGSTVLAPTVVARPCQSAHHGINGDTMMGMAMTLRLADDESEALRRRAELEHRSMQEVARQAIREYVENHSRAEVLDQVLDEELPRYAEALQRLGQ